MQLPLVPASLIVMSVFAPAGAAAIRPAKSASIPDRRSFGAGPCQVSPPLGMRSAYRRQADAPTNAQNLVRTRSRMNVCVAMPVLLSRLPMYADTVRFVIRATAALASCR